jgi:uncharacterized protein YhaN
MRFQRLRFEQFAHFADVTLDLAAGQEGLHLVYGPNEAGKSAALRAIHGFLFGISVQSPDTFRFGGPAIRLHATLRATDGTVRTLVRRKGAKQTLRDDADQPVEDAALLALLEGVPPERFTLLFGLGHAELVHGGEALLASGGAAGETLFAAAVGGVRLQRLLATVTGEAERLFKPRGATLPLNKHLEAYKQAVVAIKAASTPGKTVAELRTQAEGLRERIGTLEADLHARRTEQARLERLQKAIPLLAEAQGYANRLAALQAVPDLAADFSTRRQAAQAARARHAAAADQAARKQEILARALEALDIPEALLADGEAIVQLAGELGQYESALRDRPGQERLRDAQHDTARSILAEIRPDLSLDQVETLRISPVSRERIRERGEALQETIGEVKQLRTALAEHQGWREEIARRLQALPGLPDTEPLRLALQLGQQAIPAEQELAASAQELAALDERAAAELGRLGLWAGSLDALERLPVPSVETLDAAEQARTEVLIAIEDRRRRLREAEEGLALALEAIRALEGVGAVPSEGELAGARGARDTQWTGIRERWLTGVPDAPADPATLKTYETSVEHADDLADRLRREAERVAQHARHTAEQVRLAARAHGLTAEIAGLEQDAAAAQQGWEHAWSPCGIRPLPPREMRPWLQAREALVTLAADRRTLETRRRTLQAQVAERQHHLAGCFAALPGSDPAPAGSLQVLCRRVDAWLQDADRRRQERAAAERDQQTAEQQVARDARELDAADTTLRAARTGWGEALAVLGVGPETTPGEAHVLLDRLTALFTACERAAERDERVQEMSRLIAEYDQRAWQVVGHLAADLLQVGPLADAVRDLERRREAAARQAVQRDALRKQREDLEEERATAERDREAADRLLAELLQEGGCATIGELPAAEAAAAEKRDCRTQRVRVEALLRPFAGTGTLEALAGDAAAVNPDRLPSQLATLAQEITGAETTLKALYGEAALAERELTAVAGDDHAAEAASEAQVQLAGIRTEAGRYLRARLAGVLLQQEIARYRETHAGGLVQAAGRFFARLTCGAFSGLGERLSEREQPLLVGLRTAGGRTEEVGVEGMSAGTRDQLHLALRLAYLDRHLERNPPFPLILDDLLVNFDDGRAAAALEIFGELSRRTQVILFTHHQHLRELARAAVPQGTLFEQDLGS